MSEDIARLLHASLICEGVRYGIGTGAALGRSKVCL
jgi:hypothetical protein